MSHRPSGFVLEQNGMSIVRTLSKIAKSITRVALLSQPLGARHSAALRTGPDIRSASRGGMQTPGRCPSRYASKGNRHCQCVLPAFALKKLIMLERTRGPWCSEPQMSSKPPLLIARTFQPPLL